MISQEGAANAKQTMREMVNMVPSRFPRDIFGMSMCTDSASSECPRTCDKQRARVLTHLHRMKSDFPSLVTFAVPSKLAADLSYVYSDMTAVESFDTPDTCKYTQSGQESRNQNGRGPCPELETPPWPSLACPTPQDA